MISRIRAKWVAAIGAVILIVAILGSAGASDPAGDFLEDPVIKAMTENVESVAGKTEISLQSVAPLHWDCVYLIGPEVDAARLGLEPGEADWSDETDECRMVFLLQGEPQAVVPMDAGLDEGWYCVDWGDFSPDWSDGFYRLTPADPVEFSSPESGVLVLQTDLSDYRVEYEQG